MEELQFTLEDLNVDSSSNTYIPLVPPTTTLEDGTLEITGWVQGVSLSDYKFNDDHDKMNAIFTFSDEAGASISKYIKHPLYRSHISKLDNTDPNKSRFAGFVYGEVKNLIKKFVKSVAVDRALEPYLKAPISFPQYCELLYNLTKEPENLLPTEGVLLKIGFQKAEGVAPKYTIPQNNYLGNVKDNEKYQPKWNIKEGDKYNDIKNFAFKEATSDFSATPSLDSGIGDVFGDTLSTPSIDLN